MGEEGIEAFGVLRPGADAAAALRAQNKGQLDLSLPQIAKDRGLIDQRVQAERDEIGIHDFQNRPGAGHRGRDRHRGECLF